MYDFLWDVHFILFEIPLVVRFCEVTLSNVVKRRDVPWHEVMGHPGTFQQDFAASDVIVGILRIHAGQSVQTRVVLVRSRNHVSGSPAKVVGRKVWFRLGRRGPWQEGQAESSTDAQPAEDPDGEEDPLEQQEDQQVGQVEGEDFAGCCRSGEDLLEQVEDWPERSVFALLRANCRHVVLSGVRRCTEDRRYAHGGQQHEG